MPLKMRAWVINKTGGILNDGEVLKFVEMDIPELRDDEILIKVTACGVCHTEIDEIEGRTPPSVFPMIPGHEIVGIVAEKGKKAGKFKIGDRVGVAWIADCCGRCSRCKSGEENLCNGFKATGRDRNGGYAEFTSAKEEFAYRIPEEIEDEYAAPLLCAGAVGFRSLKLAAIRDGDGLGFTGFGASAHLVLKFAKNLYPRSGIYVFARNENERRFALELGAVWAGDTGEESPVRLKAIIDTTPVWRPVVKAMRNLEAGGRLVINAIRKEDADRDVLRELDYSKDLWLEKEIKSVANVTRQDVLESLSLATEYGVRSEIEPFELNNALVALKEIKSKIIRGAKVLIISKNSGSPI